MKTLFLLLSVFFCSMSFAQLDYVATYEPYARLIYIDKGEPALFIYDKNDEYIELYATDQSLITTIDIPYEYEGTGQYNLYHVSRQLFDCDSTNIEYLISRGDWNDTTQVYVKILRDNGDEIFSLLNHRYLNDEGLSTNPTLGSAMVEVEDGVLFSFMQGMGVGPSNNVYKSCGRVPGPCSCYSVENPIDGIVEGALHKSNFTLYPNPGAEIMHVDYDLPDDLKTGTLIIYNALGQLIYEKAVGSFMNELLVDVSGWAIGQYQVVLRSEGGDHISQSFIKVDR